MNRKWLAGAFALGLTVTWLLGASWNAAFEDIPAGTDLASDLDTFIKDLKREIRRRASVETIHGTGSNDNGLARLGSARAFASTAVPTVIDGPGQYQASSGTFPTAALTATEEGGTADLGAGRMWVDTDGGAGYPLNVWDETANVFRPVQGSGGPNLLYNGSFEATDGTGATASTSVPGGWTLATNPTLAYAAAPSSNGGGLYLSVTGVGGADGVTQTIAAAGLKASTRYAVTARMFETAGDTCSLDSTGGGTNVALATAAEGAWETVAGIIITDATPTAVVIVAQADNDTDVCLFDRIAVREVGGYGGEQLHMTTTDSASNQTNCAATFEGTAGCSDLAQVVVTPPGAGYMVQLSATFVVEPEDEACIARIAKGDTTSVAEGAAAHGASLGGINASVGVSGVDGPLTAGSAVTYEVDMRSIGGGTDCDIACDEQDCHLNALVIPPPY